MLSDDPDFLIALAEELVIGTSIHRDIKLAYDFVVRSLTVSELKGSYAMARFTLLSDRKRCLTYLKRAADLGHVPSWQTMIALQARGSRLGRRLRGLRHLPKLIGDAIKVFHKTAVREHWWRYKDVISIKEKGIYTELGEDRRYYFSWARPSSIGAFATVLANGQSEKLLRGSIEAHDLLPTIVDNGLRRSETNLSSP